MKTVSHDLGPCGPEADSSRTESASSALVAMSAPRDVVAIVLSNNRAAQIATALQSIMPHVDRVLLIDTGITDATLEIAREVAGDKLVVRSWPWQDHYGEARNAGLRLATEIGAAWGIFCDTDVTYHGAEHLRAALTPDAPDILYVAAVAGFLNAWVFRLPTTLVWTRRAHNVVVHAGEQRAIPGVTTQERVKTPEEQKTRFHQALRMLLEEVLENPASARGWYYLGDTYLGLGQSDKALHAFRACADLKGWDEESAWACFQAGYVLYTKKDWEGALHECARGLERHAGLAELYWLAGLVNQRMGRHRQAVYWARAGLVWAEHVAYVKRVGFRLPVVLRSGLWDVLRFSLRAGGDEVGACEAEQAYQQACAPR